MFLQFSRFLAYQIRVQRTRSITFRRGAFYNVRAETRAPTETRFIVTYLRIREAGRAVRRRSKNGCRVASFLSPLSFLLSFFFAASFSLYLFFFLFTTPRLCRASAGRNIAGVCAPCKATEKEEKIRLPLLLTPHVRQIRMQM